MPQAATAPKNETPYLVRLAPNQMFWHDSEKSRIFVSRITPGVQPYAEVKKGVDDTNVKKALRLKVLVRINSSDDPEAEAPEGFVPLVTIPPTPSPYVKVERKLRGGGTVTQHRVDLSTVERKILSNNNVGTIHREVNNITNIDSLNTMLELERAGCGASLVPRDTVQRIIKDRIKALQSKKK